MNDKIDKIILYIMFAVVFIIVGYVVRDYVGEKTKQECFEYCDSVGENVSSINEELKRINVLETNVVE